MITLLLVLIIVALVLGILYRWGVFEYSEFTQFEGCTCDVKRHIVIADKGCPYHGKSEYE